MKSKPLLILFIVSSIAGTCALPAAAIEVQARTDKTTVSLDDFVQLTVTITGIEDARHKPVIKLPDFEENFSVVATAQSSNYKMSNGVTEASWQLQYTLSPQKEGKLIIGSVSVQYQGQTFTTDEIAVTVSPSKVPRSIPPKQPQPQRIPWSEEEQIVI